MILGLIAAGTAAAPRGHGLAELRPMRLQSFASGRRAVWDSSALGVIEMAAAKKKKGKRKVEVVHLVCEETGDYNYTIRRKSGGEKLKLKKYSPRLRRHTLHVEKKK